MLFHRAGRAARLLPLRRLTMAAGLDLVVIGLGPAGARAAAAAAAAGARVVALDRRTRPGQPVQCAEFVPAMLDRDLAGLDAVTVQRVGRMETWVDGEVAPAVTPGFAGRMLDRAGFDALLAARAAAAGAECRFATAVTALRPDGTVLLADGVALQPRLVIGADGPRSPTGRAIGAVNTELVETRQVRLTLRRRHDATDIFLDPAIVGGYGWLFPRGDSCNLGIGLAAAHRRRLAPLLAGLAARLARAGRVGTEASHLTGGAIPVGGMVGPLGRLGRVPVVLAGDAAGLANPVTGGGIVAAATAGALAGTAAARWLGGDRAALDDYRDELAELFGPSLAHAGAWRRRLMRRWAAGGLDAAALRSGWIAFESYWTGAEP